MRPVPEEIPPPHFIFRDPVGDFDVPYGDFVKLVKASWIADTGRYHDCLKHGELNEVEPYPNYTVVHLSSLINFAPWNHALPIEQK